VRRDAQSIVLIVAEAEDAAALWLAEGLRARGLSIEVATPAQLCDSTIEHRVLGASATFRISMDDGRVLDGLEIACVLNRMHSVPLSILARTEPEDRGYVEAEWRALLCSLLHAVRGRVIEPPHPHWLSGRWRSPPEWLALAHRAGLRTPTWVWNDQEPAPTTNLDAEAEVARVLVVGDSALKVTPTPDEAVEGCRKLAALAGASVMEVRFVGVERPTFAFADQIPDLRAAGDAAITAFARMLQA
jgi:hypothetical protein